MTMNPLPPQAYTKETLLRAYSWLQNQDNSLREMASTPDIMVSLYLKATRDGDSALERPSIQNFKNELKNLSGMMGALNLNGPEVVAPKAPEPSPRKEREIILEKVAEKKLDELSEQMLQEIKNGFNLSSRSEALRLLIKLGYLKAVKILTE